MKDNGWLGSYPNDTLKAFLAEKCDSVVKRVKEATGLTPKRPVYYSAYHHYNIPALRQHILDHLPHQRRKISSS